MNKPNTVWDVGNKIYVNERPYWRTNYPESAAGDSLRRFFGVKTIQEWAVEEQAKKK